MLQKEVIVLGDVEIGGGTLTDDFISDMALSELIRELKERPHPVDLILNGDTFDFLKCPYQKNGKLFYTRHVTSKVSLSKLDLIHKAHPLVFESLKSFVQSSKNHLYFTFGNHDLDLVFPEVQQKIKDLLNSHANVHFCLKYHQHNVYVEHGMQYDALNKIKFRKKFLIYDGENVLNQPWVSFGVISKFLLLKEEHPFLERIHTHKVLFNHHHKLLKQITYRATAYFLKSVFYYPLRYFSDQTYSWPRGMLKEFYRRVKKSHWDVDKVMRVFKRNKRKTILQNKIYVLGHVHETYIENKRGVVLIHPNTWRDEYDLEPSGKLVPRGKHYVQILVTDEGHDFQLIDYPIKRTILDFEKVIKDEKKALQQAAEEESYLSPIFTHT